MCDFRAVAGLRIRGFRRVPHTLCEYVLLARSCRLSAGNCSQSYSEQAIRRTLRQLQTSTSTLNPQKKMKMVILESAGRGGPQNKHTHTHRNKNSRLVALHPYNNLLPDLQL